MFARPGLCGMGIGRLGLVAASRNAFSPLSLFSAGEQGVWYDPSDLSTLFQDAAGTVPVTAVEQPVGCMLDKSGRGNHATQSTAGYRRILRVDANGKYYLAHTGVNTWMQTNNINMTGTDKVSIFAGLQKLISTTGIFAEFSADSNSNDGPFYFVVGLDASGDGISSLSRGTAEASYSHIAFSASGNNVKSVIAVTHNTAGDLSTIRRNGVAGTSGTGDKGAGNFGNYPLYLFRRAGTSLQSDADFYGLIIRGAMSDATQISNAERWLAAKTGVTM